MTYLDRIGKLLPQLNLAEKYRLVEILNSLDEANADFILRMIAKGI